MGVPAGYEIGPPEVDEFDALGSIEVEAASVFPNEDLPPELRTEGLSREILERAAGAGRVWVVRSLRPRAPVGFAVATLVDGSAHLHEMDVLPDHAGHGLGSALVAVVARWARAEGYPGITLTTFRHLPWNAPFYARLGFAEIERAACGPELRAALAEEAEDGLDPAKRVAMRLDLTKT